ncbi:zinc finger (ccch type) motif-containing protein [Plasmopara halstedii]|uniref:Zinc finger (Ccch type) motif-containing protein n=1 Tax=Plasmopara halstedii TaxID=4781 RepID=A0A0N7L6K7_PLAHL|nr:zinc finger (ccch type) motif-containing protein [Plasmopara halstedii]CEG44547.1 zinc finger (ccch type) motif-containing protein [Plasmopara halstedii]|eukprot:XP_024580916.1 zinc finger (ccch type) motif-containing protein [Plasmopara halstedii]
MTAASDLPVEPQYEPAPADSMSEGEAAAAVTLASIEQQTTPPETGELLGRMALEISQAFQSSLVQVVSDIGREYGVETGKIAWMEKGGAVGAIASEQLHGKEHSDDSELSNDMHRILRELQLSRLQVHELQQVVDELRDEQRLAIQRIALFRSLSTKLKRELVGERLALLDAETKIKELRRRHSGDDSGSGGGRSPPSPSLQEQRDNLWSSPNKPMTGAISGAGGSGASGQASTGSSLMAFNFFPSRGDGGQNCDDDEPPSPSSSTQTLRNALLGQYLPSSLLDSPQITPKHARSFAGTILSEEKAPPLPKFKGDMEPLSLATSSFAEHISGSSIEAGRFELGDGRTETTQAEGERNLAVSPIQLSVLSELFDGISAEELESILRRFNGQESAAIDHILHTHPSFNPVIEHGGRVESGGSMASMISLSPSHSTMMGHSKTSLHRSSSQSGPSGPPPGTSSNWKTEICMYYMQGKCNKTRRTCSFAHGEGDLVRSSSSSNTGGSSKHGPNYKTRLCQAYETGLCIKSRRDCPMAHGVNDLRDSGPAPSSSGNQSTLQTTTPRLQSYKTELCYYFLKGNCNYSKDECRFAHGQNDLRTVESNTAHMVTAAASGYNGEYSTSPLPPPPLIEKQLQLQHQYQQQYHQHHHSLVISQQPHDPYPPQPPPAPPQQNFVSQHHQLQMQHPPRGSSGQYGYQHQQYDIVQQQQNPYMPSPGQFRYLKNMEEKRSTSGVRPPPRRDSGSSWSSFDASGLPPSEF